ncbi:MAG TPA: radical SAM protein, partial [Clostridiales bacterium]|nr:radical SAM protein [Clostridiales bacterium]
QELEIEPGDELISVNGASIQDYIDYKFQISDDEIELEIKKPNGEVWEFESEKEYDEDLGIIFENHLMDNIKVCSNKCVFCFIDQMPKGMRKTLYLKDDDTRLSFLYGNFITLTNLSDDEINRIIRYRISPIKVSVHATDLNLRNEMMGKKDGKDVMIYLKKLADGGITVDCQIVLCKDINDKEVLNNTIDDLIKLYPSVRSVAVVPVGLTDYRDKLYKLNKFDKESSLELINQIVKKQNYLLQKHGTRFVFIADEFYVLSESEFPAYDSYEDFDQIENGIGLFRLLEREIDDSINNIKKIEDTNKRFTIVTGAAAYDIMCELSNKISKKTGIEINVVKIINECFGKNITVAGLVTGKDIINQLKGKGYKNLIIPKVMVEFEDNIFLDDIKIEDLERELDTKVYVCEVNGKKLVDLLLKHSKEEK